MELVTRCRCHHHVTSVWPCAATWWWVGIRHFCYNAQSAHVLQVLGFIHLFSAVTMQENDVGSFVWPRSEHRVVCLVSGQN